MHVILDHLAAVIVSSVLVVMFALMQVRGLQSSSETTVNHMVRSATLDLAHLLERDLENMRSEAQVQEAITRGVLQGGTSFACNATASSDTTMQFTFPTLADPQSVAALSDPNDAPVAIVRYQLTPSTDVETRIVDGVEVDHELFSLQRLIGTTVTGGTNTAMTDFRISFASAGSATFNPANGNCPSDLNQIRFQIQMAFTGYEMDIGDKESMSQMHFSRHGATVDLVNW